MIIVSVDRLAFLRKDLETVTGTRNLRKTMLTRKEIRILDNVREIAGEKLRDLWESQKRR